MPLDNFLDYVLIWVDYVLIANQVGGSGLGI